MKDEISFSFNLDNFRRLHSLLSRFPHALVRIRHHALSGHVWGEIWLRIWSFPPQAPLAWTDFTIETELLLAWHVRGEMGSDLGLYISAYLLRIYHTSILLDLFRYASQTAKINGESVRVAIEPEEKRKIKIKINRPDTRPVDLPPRRDAVLSLLQVHRLPLPDVLLAKTFFCLSGVWGPGDWWVSYIWKLGRKRMSNGQLAKTFICLSSVWGAGYW